MEEVKQSSANNGIWLLRSAFVLLLVYVCHRTLAYDFLHPSPLALKERTAYFFVGVLSDVWLAFLVATLTTLLTAGAKRPGLGHAFFLVFFTFLTVLHQNYVEFFGHQIVPFHFRYLWDPAFLTANAGATFTGNGIIILATFALAITASFKVVPATLSRFVSTSLIGLLALVAVVAHNRNIHLRVQWFVPEQLQVQGWERLYLNIKAYRSPGDLTKEDIARLDGQTEGPLVKQLESVVLRSPPGLNETEPRGRALIERFRQLSGTQEKPLAVVYLMESQRPTEIGRFDPTKPSLTPVFDDLSTRGIEFTNAFGVSNVTRGGQEATLCGLRSGMTTSLMKGRTEIKRPCLTDVLKDSVTTAFLHGGNGGFDNQQAFWRDHGVATIMTETDFPSREFVGWGVGDLTFAKQTAIRLAALARSNPEKPVLALALSISNHIPWTLPSDIETPAQREAYLSGMAHPSYGTTKYADHALGVFVEGLKREGLWERTLLVVVSDHGNLVPPYADIYVEKKNRDAFLLSHIGLVLSGGVTEDTIADLRGGESPPDARVTSFESQADVATFLAQLFAVEAPMFTGDGLFTEPSAPVYADLGQILFIPEKDIVIKPGDLKASRDDAALHFRAYLRLLDEWTLKKNDQAPLLRPFDAEK